MTDTPAAAPKATTRAPAPKASTRARRHHVAAGETLEGIARRVTVFPSHEIMRRNKLRSTTILVGRDLDVGDVAVRAPASSPGRRRRGFRTLTLPSVVDEADVRPRAAPARPLRDLPAPPAAIEDEAADETTDEATNDEPVAYGARTRARGQSIGKPNHGHLEGGVQLPKDGAYHRRHPARSFGATHVVELTRAAIAEVRRKHPRVHKLAIGDISDPDGGRLSGHRSHQSGRDVDIGLYFKRVPKSYPQRFVGADEAPLHIAATWTLVDAFYRQSKIKGGPIAIFLDYDLQRRLADYGRKHGVDKRVLRAMFQFPGGRRSKTGFVRHEPGHHDHLHVRYGCPPRDRAAVRRPPPRRG